MREAARADCPPLEELAAAFEGRAHGARPNLPQHLQECVFCQAEWDRLAEFSAGTVDAAERGDVEAIVEQLRRARQSEGKATWWRNLFAVAPMMRLAAGVAVAAIVVAIGIEWQASRRSDLGEFAGSGEVRAGKGIAVGFRGDFREVPAELSWEAVEGTVRYEVVVKEVDGTEIWRGKTAGTRIAVAEEVRKSMSVPLRTIVWQVTAFDGKGKTLARSEDVRVQRVNP